LNPDCYGTTVALTATTAPAKVSATMNVDVQKEHNCQKDLSEGKAAQNSQERIIFVWLFHRKI